MSFNSESPAFPTEGVNQFGHLGVTKLEYFMAHAPAAPEWFKPEMPDEPEKKYFSVGVSGGAAPTVAYSTWLNLQRVQRDLQWPKYWATKMLKQLES